MKLNRTALTDTALWDAADIRIPAIDLARVQADTAQTPTWVHFGAGNIFRAFPAALQQHLLEEGLTTTGIIVAEGYDYEIIDDFFTPYDNLTLLVTLKSNGTIEKAVIGSVTEALKADPASADYQRLKQVFRAPSLQMVSFTITEKGYSLTRGDGRFMPDVAADFSANPEDARSYMGKVAALLAARYLAGGAPVAMVSMDNCSHNGEKLFAAVHAFAERWTANGVLDKGFLEYVENPARVAFPWSMIDKITPRPDDSVKAMLKQSGFEDAEGKITAKNTYAASFVNAEEAEYLVIEDAFPNGRPPLDKAGVMFTTRDVVNQAEKMKVCTCLNPLHTALAVFGCLLGYSKISDEMADPDLVRLVQRLGYTEGLPVVVDPGIIRPKDFLDEVLTVRFPNPFMPDTPQRIATDTSQKLSIRFGETIKAYLAAGRDMSILRAVPLVLAGWCRYLMAVDDAGRPFTLSPDPLLETLKPRIAGLRLGDPSPDVSALKDLWTDEKLFGVDLVKAGLAGVIVERLVEMLAGPGAVRQTLQNSLEP
ncbi:MAG: mannitol dehydrogenase family protein [Methylobacteriaceae bacterium]|jgi:fructuronate reductase|nr:mannitol dehydrogenase family protein [Methylobacteriaceae bacterium]